MSRISIKYLNSHPVLYVGPLVSPKGGFNRYVHYLLRELGPYICAVVCGNTKKYNVRFKIPGDPTERVIAKIPRLRSLFPKLVVSILSHVKVPRLIHYPYPCKDFYLIKSKHKIMTIHGVPFPHKDVENMHYLQPFVTTYELIKEKVYNIDVIVAVSHFTKNDIIHYFKVSEDRVRVIYNCVDRSVFSEVSMPEEVCYVKNVIGITRPYFLHVSTGEPHKNVKTLLKGFAEANVNAQLVLVGIKSHYVKMLLNLAEKLGVKNKITILTNFIPDKVLAMLYRQSLAFVTLSLFEGFCFPLVEALSCGKLVVVSDKAFFHEIAEDAAIYVNPHNYEEVAKTLRDIVKGKYQLFNKKSVLLASTRYSTKSFRVKYLALYKELLKT